MDRLEARVGSCTGVLARLGVFNSHLDDLPQVTMVLQSLQLQLSSAHHLVCLKQAPEKTQKKMGTLYSVISLLHPPQVY